MPARPDRLLGLLSVWYCNGASYPAVNWLGREANRSSQSYKELQKAWTCTSYSPYVFMAR